MMLTAQQILDENLLILDQTKGAPAQVGYDLSVKSISRLTTPGYVLVDKTLVPQYEPVLLTSVFVEGYGTREGYFLSPGAYDIVFHEGCRIPADRTAKIRQRSSLLRSGAAIASSIFDPGFETQNIGTVVKVLSEIFIEKDARVAQIYFQTNQPVESGKLYSGQFQRDSQRNTSSK